MVSDTPTAQGIDISAANNLVNGSPTQMYTYFLLSACKYYLDTIQEGMSYQLIEARTMALFAFCPNKQKREELWNTYLERKGKNMTVVEASVYTIGDFISYLSETLEFEATATGGYM